MRKILVLLVFVGTPLLAQDMTITAWVSRVSIDGEDNFADGFATDFEDGAAIGVSVNRFVNPWLAVEASAFGLRNDARLLIDGTVPIDLGTVGLTPVTVGAQLHLPRRPRIDPYVGAGAAYVIADDLASPDLEAGGVGRVDLENKVSWYLNAGVGVQIVEGFGIVLEGRYLPYETDSRSTITGVSQKIDLTPRLLSLGLRFRF